MLDVTRRWSAPVEASAAETERNARCTKDLGALARLVFLSFLAAWSAQTQPLSLDVSQYLHTTWTAQQGYFRGIGISNNGIAQTADGYLWLLTPTGVIRFDGARYVEWQPPAGESFPGNAPSQLLASRDGSLWIGGTGVGQLRADGVWRRYHELDKLRRVRLAEDKDGVIWVGAETSMTPAGYSLFHLDHGKFLAYELPGFRGLGLTPLFADREGRFWADSPKGIWQISPGQPKLALRKPDPTPVLSEDSAGGLLYVDKDRIRKLAANGTSEDYLGKLQSPSLNVRTMMLDRDGGLWIGTFGQGIVHWHEGRVDHFTTLDGLSSDTVESIFQDREGNVWSTSPDSIDEFSKLAVHRLTSKQGLSGDAIYSVLTDRRDNIWVGTSNGFNEIVANVVTRAAGQLDNDRGLALIETRQGRLLMTTNTRDELARERRVVPGIGGGSWLEGYGNVFSVAEDNDGTLWAVSQQLGLLHLRESGTLIDAINDPKWGDYALSVAFDPIRKGVWFSTHNAKVFFRKDGKIVESYGRAEGLGTANVRILDVDQDRGVWLAANPGLVHIVDHKVSILGVNNGLPCDTVHWMRHDRNHHVWLYTGCGLLSITDEDLSAWVAQPSHRVSITTYLDNTEGVENVAVGGWYAPENALTADGRILFAMRTGLGVLDPHHLNRNDLPPPVHVEEISTDGREMDRNGLIQVPPKPGAVRIVYTALSLVAPRKVRFRYRLQGQRDEWSPPVSLREVTYTNLPPGHYTFQVTACNNNGVWNNEGAMVRFSVAPSWYQTFLFRCFAALAFVAVLTFSYLVRVGRMEREMRLRYEGRMMERVRIARELHDTLLQSLQGLVLSFSSFSARVTATLEVREELERSLERADQLLVSGRERIKDLRGESLNDGDLTTALSAAVDETLGDFGPHFDVKVEGYPKPLRDEVQEETVWIVREALANARQHAGASAVQLQVFFQGGEFRVAVQDNGVGLGPNNAQASRDGHFGMIGMRERAKAIGGRLSVQSSPGKGTSIGLAVPGRLAYRENQSWFANLRARIAGRNGRRQKT